MKKIHLDTFDYSKIIKSDNPENYFQKIELIKNKGHSFYFSSITLTETKPDTSAKNKEIILKHAEAIEEICESNCLINFLDLFNIEKQCLNEKKALNENFLFNQKNWLSSEIRDDLINETYNSASAILKIPNNRQERRNYLKDNKFQKSELIKKLSTSQELKSAPGLKDFIKKIDKPDILTIEILTNEFLSFINSPKNAVSIFGSNKINNHEFSEWLYGASTLYCSELIEEIKNADFKSIDEKLIYFEKSLTSTILESIFKTSKIPLNDYKKYCKGAYSMASLTAKVILQSSNLFSSPRKAKPSDFGDFLHSSFIPYIDIMRMDRFMHEKLKNSDYYDKINSEDLDLFLESLI